MKKLILIITFCIILVSSFCLAGDYRFGTVYGPEGAYDWHSHRIGNFEFGTMYGPHGEAYDWSSHRIGNFEFGTMYGPYGNAWDWDSYEFGCGN